MTLEFTTLPAGTPAQTTDLIAAARAGAPVSLTPEDITSMALPHGSYYFHGFAGDQIAGDTSFYDLSGQGNHAAPGANLSNAAMFANAGFVSTVAPAGGATDSVLRLPSLNFDYSGGETLIGWWLGRVTAPGTDQAFIGDGYGTPYPGLRLRAKSAGKFDLSLYSSTASGFGAVSTDTCFDGTLHSLAFILDGTNKKYGMWVDEVFDSAFGGNTLTFHGGTDFDTTNANTFQIGSSAPAAAAAVDGVASQTRGLSIIRLSSADPVPTVERLTSLFKTLRANASKPLNGMAFQ